MKFQTGERPPQTRINPPIIETGMVCAIISSLSGGGPFFAPIPLGRGGRRNLSSRESHELTIKQVVKISSAPVHAAAIGLPFTRMITIHWQAAGLPLDGMANAVGRYLDLLTKLLVRHGYGTAWAWVHENAQGRHVTKGGHSHILAHVPPDMVGLLQRRQRGWLKAITGQPYKARVIKSEPIGGRLGLETGNPNLHHVNLGAALAYVVKGAPQEVLDRLGIDRAHEPGGRIIGKRCGISQNLGAKALCGRCQ